MRAPRRDSEYTKAEILRAARRLFAERGIPTVSVRDIAKEAGVTHGLVHHYFGTKEDLAAQVVREEVDRITELVIDHPFDASTESREAVRSALRYFFTEGAMSTLLIARAELSGYQPEKWISVDKPTALTLMAERLSRLQTTGDSKGLRLDPALVSVYSGAAVMGLTILRPWLMTAAGLRPEEYEERLDEIIDIAATFIAVASGALPVQK